MEKSLEQEASDKKMEEDFVVKPDEFTEIDETLSLVEDDPVEADENEKVRPLIMDLINTAETDADVFWEMLLESNDDVENLFDTVDMLVRLYLQRKTKTLFWTFAVMKGEGIKIPLYIVTGAPFVSMRGLAFYVGPFLMRVAWRLQQTMEELDMKDFLVERLAE